MLIMKIKELLESPYLHSGKLKVSTHDTFTSHSSIDRMYDLFAESQFGSDHLVKFYMLKDIPKIIGVVSAQKPKTGEDSNLVIFSMFFKKQHTLVKIPSDFAIDKILQVDLVSTAKTFMGFGMASFVYATLVKKGFIVISDTSQFEDGAQLWKKMAREANVENYKVFILDDEYGFLKDENGNVLEYDSHNIADSKIWSKDADFMGSHILLVMK